MKNKGAEMVRWKSVLRKLPDAGSFPAGSTNTIEENVIMNVKCVKCEKNAYLKHRGRAAGTLIGGGAGGYVGWTAGAAGGAKVGGLVGSFFGPVGTAAGVTVGSLLGALTGAATGAAAGNKLGGMIDEDVVREYHCPSCGHDFKL